MNLNVCIEYCDVFIKQPYLLMKNKIAITLEFDLIDKILHLGSPLS